MGRARLLIVEDEPAIGRALARALEKEGYVVDLARSHADSLERLAAMGCDRFVELGPGTVIAGLVKRTLPSARVASFGALADLESARRVLDQ